MESRARTVCLHVPIHGTEDRCLLDSEILSLPDTTSQAASSQHTPTRLISKNFALRATHGVTRWHSIQQGCRESETLILAPARPGETISNKVPRVCGVVRPPRRRHSTFDNLRSAQSKLQSNRAQRTAVNSHGSALGPHLLEDHHETSRLQPSGNCSRLSTSGRSQGLAFLGSRRNRSFAAGFTTCGRNVGQAQTHKSL